MPVHFATKTMCASYVIQFQNAMMKQNCVMAKF